MAGLGPQADATRNRASGQDFDSLYDYGIIGNQETAALVSRDGSIDWACFPRFDSPSVFARLLDRRVGGFHELRPRSSYVSHQQYVTGTNVLTTVFEISGGTTLTVTDFMPVDPRSSGTGGDPRIVRRMIARGGPVDVPITAHPRFDYGRLAPTWSANGEVLLAEAGSSHLIFTSPWPWSIDGEVARSSGTVDPGTPLFAQIRWGAAPRANLSPSELLSMTDAYWRAWVSPKDGPLRRMPAQWHPWVERSELVLKLLSPADTGVFVAAPTTSLPEWPGGSRNWDYRYVWLRDAAFTAQVFLLLGHIQEATAYVDWALTRAAQLGPGEDLRTVYAVDGSDVPPEADVAHLEGYLGSRPVRVGNDAAKQRQLDVYGEILDSALMLVRADPASVRRHWDTVERLARRTTELWNTPDSGIWEFRTPPTHYVHSKLMCWVALDRAIQVAETLGKTSPVEHWREVAEEIRVAVLAHGYDERRGSFIQAFDRPRLDASALRIPIVGFLPPSDARVLSTLSAIEQTLDHRGLLLRYEGDDGSKGPEGAFLLCSLWYVETLARCGRMDRALERWRSIMDIAGPLRLFSEEYDPVSARPLGNFPQALTHIGVLRAALALGLKDPEP